MNIKNLSAKFSIAIILFAVSAVLLRAQNPTNGSDSNAVTAQAAPSMAGTNVPTIQTSGGNGTVTWANNSHGGFTLRRQQSLDVNRLAAILSPFVFTFGMTVAILAIIFYSRHRQNKLMHETIRAMIDKGMPVTPELIAQLDPKGVKLNFQGKLFNGRPRNRRLLPALVLIGIGLAMTGFHPWHAATGGVIVLFIGLAFFIVWLVERKQNGDCEPGMNTERKQDNDQQPPKV